MIAADFGRDEVVRSLLDEAGSKQAQFVELSRCNAWGLDALIAAARRGHHTTVSLLLRAGAPLHASSLHGQARARSTHGDDWSALHHAAVAGHTLCAEALLDASWRLCFTPDAKGATPTQLAAEHGHASLSARLLELGHRRQKEAEARKRRRARAREGLVSPTAATATATAAASGAASTTAATALQLPRIRPSGASPAPAAGTILLILLRLDLVSLKSLLFRTHTDKTSRERPH